MVVDVPLSRAARGLGEVLTERLGASIKAWLKRAYRAKQRATKQESSLGPRTKDQD